MGHLVTPKVFQVGTTVIYWQGLREYLYQSNNMGFLNEIDRAQEEGLSEGEILTSFYAKLCYASLTLGKNENITQVRGIKANLEGCHNQGHNSVWQHVSLNFVATNVSRVFTHELVRHRAGSAFSQTSGRYVRGDTVDIVFDPILEPVREDIESLQMVVESIYLKMVKKMGLDTMKDQTKKKQITSALRRILPNGQSNEIGFSLNLGSLRHIVQVRTSRHAEWEIRHVFNTIYHMLKDKYPLLFFGAVEEVVEGLTEVSGMKMQPYDKV